MLEIWQGKYDETMKKVFEQEAIKHTTETYEEKEQDSVQFGYIKSHCKVLRLSRTLIHSLQQGDVFEKLIFIYLYLAVSYNNM